MRAVSNFFVAIALAFGSTLSGLVFLHLLIFKSNLEGYSVIGFGDANIPWIPTIADWAVTNFGVINWLVLPLIFIASTRSIVSGMFSNRKEKAAVMSLSSLGFKLILGSTSIFLLVLCSMYLPEFSPLVNGNGGVLGHIFIAFIPLYLVDSVVFTAGLFMLTFVLSYWAFTEIRTVVNFFFSKLSRLLYWIIISPDQAQKRRREVSREAENKKIMPDKAENVEQDGARVNEPSEANNSQEQSARGKILENTISDAPGRSSEKAVAQAQITNTTHESAPNQKEIVFNPEANQITKKKAVKSKWLYEKSKSKPVKTAAAKPIVRPPSSIDYRKDIYKILAKSNEKLSSISEQEQLKSAELLKATLEDFNVRMEIGDIVTGPVVTRYEFHPPAGFKVAMLAGITKDLARVLTVSRVRIVETIPGKSTIGIELPNKDRLPVTLGGIIGTDDWVKAQDQAIIPVVVGRTVEGNAMVLDIASMPHLLVAGTTGSGKSVGVNSMLISALSCYSPNELRLVLVDPKVLEFASFQGLPHLLCDVVTEMDKSDRVLAWCVAEMDRRYIELASAGVRNIEQYNKENKKAMPYLLIVIDEWADMMMATGKQSEQLVVRLAQKARASGIHLVLATQRPSVDVITGLIKSNIPARICYQVASQIDSRTMLDSGGGEMLLGKGDALYKKGGIDMTRVHGAFVGDEDIDAVVNYWKKRASEYSDLETLSMDELLDQAPVSESEKFSDDMYHQAIEVARTSPKVSISKIQRKLGIGFNRAANFVEQMEEDGIVSPPDSKGSRNFIS